MATEHWVEGETAPRDYQLVAGTDGQDLTGLTVTLILTKQDGEEVDTSNDITKVDEAAGIVRYTPDPLDIAVANSPLRARWRVESGDSVKFFPKGPADSWVVFKP